MAREPAPTLMSRERGDEVTMTDQEQHRWPWLHDATLVDLHLDWKTGVLTISLRMGIPRAGVFQLRGNRISLLDCPRRFPWGASVSVNDVRGPSSSPEGERLEIEVQSGDTLVVIAESFALDEVS